MVLLAEFERFHIILVIDEKKAIEDLVINYGMRSEINLKMMKYLTLVNEIVLLIVSGQGPNSKFEFDFGSIYLALSNLQVK